MEPLKHECGVAMIRLLKPLEYFHERYGTWRYPLNKLYLMMEKQHNRGQEAAGIGCLKLDCEPGEEYMFRERAVGSGAITEIFDTVNANFADLEPGQEADVGYVQKNKKFVGEIYLGHLRYSTTGKSGLDYVHPFARRNNWRARNLCLCGNFNMANFEDIFDEIAAEGQYPRFKSDTYVILEQLGHRLDCESERLFDEARCCNLSGVEVTRYIDDNIHRQIRKMLKDASKNWDGGYVMCGFTGSGEAFAMRDPWGIRPAYYYQDDEIFVLASERPVIQTTFNLEVGDVHELMPGDAVTISRGGKVTVANLRPPQERRSCSFERIYFSRGADAEIYRERKALGELLVGPILNAIGHDIANTVFSFIPNTAEVAYYGMLEGLNKYHHGKKIDQILALGHQPSRDELERICSACVRSEKVALKDIKLRTFITENNSRNDLAAHVYDITYGSLRPYEDNIVIIDDSIVRGTTLRESVIRILDRLHPKKIVIVSSAPQIRYPDYYGIDMSHLSEFIAFKAAIELRRDRGELHIVSDVYRKCLAQRDLPRTSMQNYVKEIYSGFSDGDISRKIVELLRPHDVDTDIEIVFQTIEGLHAAIPAHAGDWYFSGDYPTPAGVKRVSEAFVEYYEECFGAGAWSK